MSSLFSRGARNANDAISLIQTAGGAFAVIDKKRIRMEELAEQAATRALPGIADRKETTKKADNRECES